MKEGDFVNHNKYTEEYGLGRVITVNERLQCALIVFENECGDIVRNWFNFDELE